MSWITQTLTSTIGRKLLMALSGIFLITFLVIHLIGNLQLLKADAGQAFNTYAEFMGHALIIRIISIVNFGLILLHIIISLVLTVHNRRARPVNYAYHRPQANSAWSSRNMGILGTVILIFLVVHLSFLWGRAKFGHMPTVFYTEGGEEYEDLFRITQEAFQQPWIVGLYVLSMVALGFHLLHGFQSAFQTLGVRHVKYSPVIEHTGRAFSVLVPLAFAVIPVAMYLGYPKDPEGAQIRDIDQDTRQIIIPEKQNLKQSAVAN